MDADKESVTIIREIVGKRVDSRAAPGLRLKKISVNKGGPGDWGWKNLS